MSAGAAVTVFGVDHVQLPVPRGGLPAARGFYEHTLGLAELRHPSLDRPGTLRYALGDQRLDLVECPAVAISPQAHLALRVGGVDALAAVLTAQGIVVDDAPLAGRPRLYVLDPFGHRLELIEADRSADLHQEDADDAAVGG